jgi:hypothetical protein
LAVADEGDSVDNGGIVVAVPVALPLRLGQKPLLFVKTERVARHIEAISDFSNKHWARLTLDLEVHFKVYGEGMEITLQYFEGCPNWKVADQHIDELVREFPQITVSRQLVDTVEEAERVGFRGSPSILFDGVDPFAQADAPVGLACRRYITPDGFAGAPTVDQLREELNSFE